MSQKALTKYQNMVFQHCKSVDIVWIDKALDTLVNLSETTVKTTFKKRKRVKIIPAFEQAILEIMKAQVNPLPKPLERALGVSERTAQRYTQKLCQLRWLIKGRCYMRCDLNPFLELMIQFFPKKVWKLVSKFASQQVDLIDLFALPLQLALDDKVLNVEIIWSQHHPNWGKLYFPKQAYDVKVYPYWNGIIQFKVETDKKTHYAVLPYNIHWTGRNCHITLPIPFKFYGIESAVCSKSETKIHFDNSIKTTIPLGSASYNTRRLLHKHGMKHGSDSANRFMTKYWKNEYAECFNFETHEQVLRDRLINKKISIAEITDKHFRINQFLGY